MQKPCLFRISSLQKLFQSKDISIGIKLLTIRPKDFKLPEVQDSGHFMNANQCFQKLLEVEKKKSEYKRKVFAFFRIFPEYIPIFLIKMAKPNEQ